MKKNLSLRIICLLLCIALLGGCASKPEVAETKPEETKPAEAESVASNFPKSTVTIIVPYAAGGGTDLIARALSSHLSSKWGVSVIVENKTGGSGAVGMSALSNAKPDGYTVIFTALAAATITPVLNDVGYTNKEFAPIAQITEMNTALCVHSNSGIKTFEELVEKASANPKKLTYGTTGAASLQNLLTVQLQAEMGKPEILNHIPFDGGAQAISALVGEQTDACVAMVPDLIGHIDSGTFTPLVVYTSERIKELPDVPCVSELGYPSVALPTWYGFAAPAGTPEEILDFWDGELKSALEDAEVQKILVNLKQNPVHLNRAEFTERWMNTYEQNSKMLKGN